jgi:hypothetical protein
MERVEDKAALISASSSKSSSTHSTSSRNLQITSGKKRASEEKGYILFREEIDVKH